MIGRRREVTGQPLEQRVRERSFRSLDYRDVGSRRGRLFGVFLLAEELEVGFLMVPVTLVALRRAEADWVISLELRGMVG